MKKSALFLVPALVLLSCSQASTSKPHEAWNPANDPLLMGGMFDRNSAQLPSSGKVDVQPWTDTYWPSSEGGIANRWQTHDNGFSYTSPKLSALKQMSTQQIARLSPAEKYDIFVGRYDYPTVRSERSRTSPNAPSWEGLCHGWSPAAILFKEPKPVTLRNSDGIEIPFGSSDIKALLTYYQGNIASGRTGFLGERCNSDLNTNPGAGSSSACRDTNAGSFHIVLTNLIGRQKKSFIVDVERSSEVWNQPLYAYRSQISAASLPPSIGAAPGTVKEQRVVTQLYYTVESQPTWDAWGTDQNITSRTYQYRLELNANGDIIGGEWESDERPDFMWTQDKMAFGGYFASLEKIYTAATGGVVTPEPAPTAAPTAQPTAVPTSRPTQPPMSGTQPIAGSQAPYCPAGYSATSMSGGSVCADSSGNFVKGPFPKAMVDQCKSTYFAGYCSSDRWPADVYKQFRGYSSCPAGSSSNGGVCTDSSGFAYGPFTNDLVARCVSAGFGSSCSQMVWNYGIISQLNH